MTSGWSMEHWTHHVGLFSWFQLSFPPSWSVVERDRQTLLRSASGQSTLEIKVSWQDAPIDEQKALQRHLLHEYRVHRKVRRLYDAHESPNIGWQAGEWQLARPQSLWKRLWEKAEWKPFLTTLLWNGPILISAHVTHNGERDHEFETISKRVIRSIRFNQQPCDPPSVFLARAIDYIRSRHPDLPCRQAGDLQLHLGNSTVSLINFYREYLLHPQMFEHILSNAIGTLLTLQQEIQGQFRPTRESVSTQLFPMLYPQKSIRHAVGPGLFDSDHWEGGQLTLATKGSDVLGFVCEAFAGDLALTYVVDEDQAYWYVQPDQLEDWGMTYEELRNSAIENLDRHFEESPMEITVIEGEAGPTLAMPTRPDAYNAARLASETFRERLRRLFGGSCVVGIPNRDFFVAVSLDSPETIEQIRQRVSVDHQHMAHPLTSRLILITADGVSEYI